MTFETYDDAIKALCDECRAGRPLVARWPDMPAHWHKWPAEYGVGWTNCGALRLLVAREKGTPHHPVSEEKR